jgi:eukaryotic-like serine/threonine-protein kinase
MGEVWAARDTQTGLAVCVKLMRIEEEDQHDEHLRAHAEDRLRTEGRVLGLLAGHPNIVSCRDAGRTHSGVPFLVLELLQGESLRALLKQKGTLPAAAAVPVMSTLLRTLHWIHARGIVHRDLKPDNVVLAKRDDGQTIVKLLDFGVAKLVTDAMVQRIAPAHRTAKGTFIGTLRYVSPEQVLLLPVDARSDVYSAGAMLFALLTGASPFAEQKTVMALADAMRREGFEGHLGDVPPALRSAVRRALAFRADDRFQTAADFADALDAIDLPAPQGDSDDDAITRIVEQQRRQAPAELLAAASAPRASVPAWLFVSIALTVACVIVVAAVIMVQRGIL